MDIKKYNVGIIGKPLSHSISPAIQTAAFDSVNLCGEYGKYEIEINALASQIQYFVDNKFLGFNVTIPYKVEILKYLNSLDSLAEKIGAVNTVKISKSGKLKGYNTDIYGFIKPLEKYKKIDNAKIIGAGGASLAVIFGLDYLNCKNITIYVRNIIKAENALRNIKTKITSNIDINLIQNIEDLSDTDILINATPLGTKGVNENEMPISEEIFKSANSNMLIYDLVYNPQVTKLLKTAKKYNLKTINGLDMLIYQGAKAFEIWTEKNPNIQEMKKSALEELN